MVKNVDGPRSSGARTILATRPPTLANQVSEMSGGGPPKKHQHSPIAQLTPDRYLTCPIPQITRPQRCTNSIKSLQKRTRMYHT